MAMETPAHGTDSDRQLAEGLGRDNADRRPRSHGWSVVI